jgi:predicted metallo-beta-lactamase superfamily hydrolase
MYTDRQLAAITHMHYDAHQPIIDDLEARILTIRDSL